MTSAKRKLSQHEDEINAKIQCLNPKDDEDYFDSALEEEIKQFSSDQRLAVDDEPTCVVCGKYGEYINDETNHDICSLQCKEIDSDLSGRQQKQQRITDVQEHVASNLHAKLTNYQEPTSIATQSVQQVTQMLQAHEVEVKGSHIPKPFTTFDQLREILGKTLLSNIEELGWSMATGIQRQAVTIGLAGRDLLAIAPTHAGKTGSFLIPLLVHCHSLSIQDNYKRRAGPYALIMAPTREICSQIEHVCQHLSKGLRNMRTGLLIGGEPMPNQLFRLKQGVQVIVGTPGRILDMATHHPKLLRIWKVRMVVLDEADAMFSLGFGTQVKQILGKLNDNTKRQTLLFSATMSDDKMLQSLYKRLLRPIEIKVSQQEATTIPKTSDQLRQTIIWVDNKSKSKKLFSILRDPKYFHVPVLIFVASRLGAEFLTRAIKKKMSHVKVIAMHGDKAQEERNALVKSMTDWDIVVSTDVLARGIDLPSVKLVINYDMTNTLDDYVHRVGRAVISSNAKGIRGWAITFINEEHQYLLESFAKMLSTKSLASVTPLPTQLKRFL